MTSLVEPDLFRGMVLTGPALEVDPDFASPFLKWLAKVLSRVWPTFDKVDGFLKFITFCLVIVCPLSTARLLLILFPCGYFLLPIILTYFVLPNAYCLLPISYSLRLWILSVAQASIVYCLGGRYRPGHGDQR